VERWNYRSGRSSHDLRSNDWLIASLVIDGAFNGSGLTSDNFFSVTLGFDDCLGLERLDLFVPGNFHGDLCRLDRSHVLSSCLFDQFGWDWCDCLKHDVMFSAEI
jgi:hypothetical protein